MNRATLFANVFGLALGFTMPAYGCDVVIGSHCIMEHAPNDTAARCIAKWGSAQACIDASRAFNDRYTAATSAAETAARAKAATDRQWLLKMQAETRAIDAQTELSRLRDRLRMYDGRAVPCSLLRSPLLMARVTVAAASTGEVRRFASGLAWFDAAIGGGLVPGSVIMLSGHPGAGKSTLLAQLASTVANSVYCSAEETAEQVASRVRRLGGSLALPIVTGRDVETVLIEAGYCSLLIVDSVQTMTTSATPDQGGHKAVLAVSNAVVDYARRTGAVAVLIVHQVKGGGFAGPGTLEHLIDVNLELSRSPRALSVIKNRFGIAGFAVSVDMTAAGIMPVAATGSAKRRRWRFKLMMVALVVLFAWMMSDGAQNKAHKDQQLQAIVSRPH